MTLIENAKQSLVYKYAAKSISRKRLSVEGKVPSTAVARNVGVYTHSVYMYVHTYMYVYNFTL